METVIFEERHFEQMKTIDDMYQSKTFDEVKSMIDKGAEIVRKNKGFANLDYKLAEKEEEMIDVMAFINFRTAKVQLDEDLEEIND